MDQREITIEQERILTGQARRGLARGVYKFLAEGSSADPDLHNFFSSLSGFSSDATGEEMEKKMMKVAEKSDDLDKLFPYMRIYFERLKSELEMGQSEQRSEWGRSWSRGLDKVWERIFTDPEMRQNAQKMMPSVHPGMRWEDHKWREMDDFFKNRNEVE